MPEEKLPKNRLLMNIYSKNVSSRILEKVRKKMYEVRLNLMSIVTVVNARRRHPAYGDHQLFIVLFNLRCPGNSCVLLHL